MREWGSVGVVGTVVIVIVAAAGAVADGDAVSARASCGRA